MPNPLDLTNEEISVTYPRVVQVDSDILYDGLGNLIIDLSTVDTGGLFIFTQSPASTTWVIAHNLHKLYPSITVVDTGGDIVLNPIITPTNANNLTLTFSSAIAGVAYLS